MGRLSTTECTYLPTLSIKYMKKICFCGFWAFYYHQRSVLTFIS